MRLRFGDLGFEAGGSVLLEMMLRGGRLAGLASRMVGAKPFSTEIFVSRLSFYTTEEELKNVFSPFGAVEEARLVRDNQTGRPKGFGFVKYSSQADAEKAVKAMDGRIIRGRLIFVEIAKE
ncbi:glycine-rich RNA-binding protein 4, mitochondrial-like isoform X1 [Oryza glaberrima]|uniref:glycine-rich RNA-binding protein 4, mitochondrial-like isoform X1 n=1 Tax=Oryza glaberrima TaxID=4538 RepID=UPI00224C4486|nr:glycine-rich RNA-binding protein 4, mitochondrial-like isoform X1 [Oryza glaberrima]